MTPRTLMLQRPAPGAIVTRQQSPENRPPHAEKDEFPLILLPLITTDDVLDYAEWLDVRFESVRRDLIGDDAWADKPATEFDPYQREWVVLYGARWSPWFSKLRESYWARVDSWDRVKAFHAKLVDLVRRANAHGHRVEAIEAPPRAESSVAGGANEVANRVERLGLYAAVVAVAYFGAQAVGLWPRRR